MTEYTKKLFAAPYKVCETRNGYNVICTNKVLPQLCWTTDKKDANRIARLPELYDALCEAAGGKCWSCAGVNVDSILGNGCPKGNDETCDVAKWFTLLRKVRDGE